MRIEGQAGIDGSYPAGQGIEVILVGIVLAHVQDEHDILVLVTFVPAETDDTHLFHTGDGGEGILQVVRIDVLAGFIDNDILQAPFDVNPAAVIHPGHVSGGIPAAVLRVRRQDFALYHTSGMDAGTANLQFTGSGTVFSRNAVL